MGKDYEGGKDGMTDTEVLNYLDLMFTSLLKKERALKSILDITKIQEELLNKNTLDEVSFLNTLDKKGLLIEEVNKLDEGFNLTYERIEVAIKNAPSLYEERIRKLQDIIKTVTDKSVEIEVSERRNKVKFELLINKSKEKVRNYNISNSVANSYYKNMVGAGSETFFIDKKK